MHKTQSYESLDNTQPPSVEWQSDHIVESPNFTSNLVTKFHISADDLWAGPRGITRIGPASEGYGGYLLPPALQRVVKGTRLAFMLPPTAEHQKDTLPRQLEIGAGIPDGNGSEELIVVELDNESKRITFEAKWYEGNIDRQDLHYSWEIHVLEGSEPSTSLLFTRTRIEGLENPDLWKKAGPVVDRMTMRLVKRGILEKSPAPPNMKKKLGSAVIAASIAGLVLTAAKKRRS